MVSQSAGSFFMMFDKVMMFDIQLRKLLKTFEPQNFTNKRR